MPIKLKVARTAKELDDVFRLRYDVYVNERGKFSEKRSANDGRIVDHFDTLPGVANVVAYDGDTAIASFRVNRDSDIGLAPEKYFDFDQARACIAQSGDKASVSPCVVSGSMLAIRKQWRHKRNVIFALFKKTAAVMHSLGATHVFGAASAETFSLYGRLGFKAIAEEQWVESVGDELIPMMAPFDKVFEWAFGQSEHTAKHFWLDNYCAQFETLLLSPGEVLFGEHDRAGRIYSIERGGITLSQQGANQKDVVIAQLGHGSLFDGLGFFDSGHRSTTATATMNTQIIAIEQSQMLDIVHKDPGKLDQLLNHFAHRLQDGERLTVLRQFGAQANHENQPLEHLWRSATAEGECFSTRVLKLDIEQLAKRTPVREIEVHEVFDMSGVDGGLGYSAEISPFFREPSNESIVSTRGSQ